MTDDLSKLVPEGFTSMSQFLETYQTRVLNGEEMSLGLHEAFNRVSHYALSNGNGFPQEHTDTISETLEIISQGKNYR